MDEYPMRYLVFLISFLAVALPIAPAAHAQTRCIVYDPTEDAVNVRASPNGKIINRLRNGRVVQVNYYRNDTLGRPWAWVEGDYNGF